MQEVKVRYNFEGRLGTSMTSFKEAILMIILEEINDQEPSMRTFSKNSTMNLSSSRSLSFLLPMIAQLTWKLLNCPIDGLGAEPLCYTQRSMQDAGPAGYFSIRLQRQQSSEAIFLAHCIFSLVWEFLPILSMHTLNAHKPGSPLSGRDCNS
jgi:hypothetical protein